MVWFGKTQKGGRCIWRRNGLDEYLRTWKSLEFAGNGLATRLSMC